MCVCVCVCVCVCARAYERLNWLTGLSRPPLNGLAPGPGSDAVERLNADLVLGPLLQVLDGELPLQAVRDDVVQQLVRGSDLAVLNPVPHQLWSPVILPLRERLSHKEHNQMHNSHLHIQTHTHTHTQTHT